MIRTLPLLFLVALPPAGCGDGDSASDAEVSADDGRDVRADDASDPDDAGPAADADDGDGEAGGSCGSCHGTAEHPNPPPDLVGETDRGARGVGAHEAHLAAAEDRAAVRCAHCHTVPESVDAPGHVDASRPADVAFWGLAARGVEPVWDGAQCTVYCHGGAMRIDPRSSPAWTSTAGTTCTACHDLPPAAPHPAASDCGRCHLEVADEGGAIVSGLLHIDSIVAAPHGAHLVHLGGAGGGDWPCTTCHPDGVAYHGPLRDGRPLEETTVCDPCHAPGTYDAAAWRDYEPFGPP